MSGADGGAMGGVPTVRGQTDAGATPAALRMDAGSTPARLQHRCWTGPGHGQDRFRTADRLDGVDQRCGGAICPARRWWQPARCRACTGTTAGMHQDGTRMMPGRTQGESDVSNSCSWVFGQPAVLVRPSVVGRRGVAGFSSSGANCSCLRVNACSYEWGHVNAARRRAVKIEVLPQRLGRVIRRMQPPPPLLPRGAGARFFGAPHFVLVCASKRSRRVKGMSSQRGDVP